MLVRIVICLAIGYCFGLFQTGYVYGRLVKGIDIRDYGSHSSGATNTVRTLGKGAGYIVFAGDVLKMVAAVHLVRFIIFPSGAYAWELSMIAGIGVILGHDFPFYMHFKGGKGISATGGLMLALNPLIALIEGILFGIVFYSTRYVSVASLTVTAVFPFMLLIFFPGHPFMVLIAAIIAAFDWWQHRSNIGRLRHGTENRFDKKKKG